MATVASLVRAGGGYMDFIDYLGTYKDDNKEFLRSDLWELSFTTFPKVVYNPGSKIINARLQQVQVGIQYGITPLQKRMRGNWDIMQSVAQSTSGQLNMNFFDREDQAISYMFMNWRDMISDPETRYSFRKDDLVCDIKLTLTNSTRNKVRTLDFFNCSLTDASLNENGDDQEGGDRSDVTVGFWFEHYSRSWDNI